MEPERGEEGAGIISFHQQLQKADDVALKRDTNFLLSVSCITSCVVELRLALVTLSSPFHFIPPNVCKFANHATSYLIIVLIGVTTFESSRN